AQDTGALPITIAVNETIRTDVDLTSGANVTLTGQRTITKTGGGAWTVNGLTAPNGVDLHVNGGTVNLDTHPGADATAGAAAVTTSSITVSGSTVKLGANQTLGGLNVQNGNDGIQTLDLNGHSMKVYGSDLPALETSTNGQLALLGETDGITDSSASSDR